ncbi:hypothetical protein BBK14_27730 [Parafrankia soli]|uniref:ABM domain-containing protein n=1 Tax=Parafrankia soli TaxID=2599596 RepID=A0A1S1PHQ4_9ACTN|nr:hypothetical protein BBK14_27730 [Parafrankia soli]
MSAMLLRTKVKPEKAAEVEAAVKSLFAALDQARPQGIRYASYRLEDGVTYVVLLQVEEGIENPLPKVPEFLEFQQNLRGWLAEPPAPEQLTVIGDYQS